MRYNVLSKPAPRRKLWHPSISYAAASGFAFGLLAAVSLS